MMAVWAGVLITYGVSTGIATVVYKLDDGLSNCNSCALTSVSKMTIKQDNLSLMSLVPLKVYAAPELKDVTALDMAPNSVDDMYNGCKVQMKTKVQTEYLPNEKNTNKKFKQAWDEAEQRYNTKWSKKGTRLGKELVVAIYVYSFGREDIYKDINTAVRTGQPTYKTTFGYHAVHFFLTDAIQTLNARKPEGERCLTVYRGVDLYFSQDVLQKEVRFGSFTSTTMRGFDIAKKFGEKSCFKIVTCYGADISMFSRFGEAEAEVLILPYEVFIVTEIKKRSEQKDLECEVVYKMKSTRTVSNLDCALFPK